MSNLEHYLDLGHTFFTKLGWKPGNLKAIVNPGSLPGSPGKPDSKEMQVVLDLPRSAVWNK